MFEKVTDEIRGIVQMEVAAAKREVQSRAKRNGVGLGLLAGAALLISLAAVALTIAALAALATAMATWLAALIVAAVYALVAVAMALAGKGQLKKGGAPLPSDTVANLKQDVRRARADGRAAAAGEPVEPIEI